MPLYKKIRMLFLRPELESGTRFTGGIRKGGLAFLAACPLISAVAITLVRGQTLPSNVLQSVTVPPATFDGWFQGTSGVTLNGVVNPANSVTFSNNPNGDFYRWSWQMFLWLTSPAPATYGGGGGNIFSSPTFYDISPETNGVRTLIPHTASVLRGVRRPFIPKLALRSAQVGPHGLPVITSKTNQMFELVPAASPVAGLRKSVKRLLVLNKANQSVQATKFKVVNRKVVFLDATGKQIVGAHAVFPKKFQSHHFVTKLNLGGIIIFIDPFNNVVNTEVGQADGGTLMTQGKSLVYYRSMVNDVYAYFLTGTKDGGIPANSTNSTVVGGVTTFIFPTTAAGLSQVTTFAAAHGKTFPDPNALAVEVKSAWVVASTLPSTAGYITAECTIPTYNTTSTSTWNPTGTTTTLMALVGMHVVGSTAGHPEMVWATFEHFGNTPNETYQFLTSSNTVATQPRDSLTGPWLFCSPTHTGNFNVPHMSNDATQNAIITANSGFTISPSDTMRFIPFGGAAGVSPNPLDPTVAASNSEIISIDNSVLGQLAPGDVRANYYLTGATWTIGGAPPTSAFGNPGNFSGNGVGTSQMGNSTMETYQCQSNAFSAFGNNCFECHQSNSSTVSTTAVSHLFPVIKKLF